MTWLSHITGIHSDTPPDIRAAMHMDGTDLVRNADGARFKAGALTTPTLADLRAKPMPEKGPLTVAEVVADAQALHADPANAGATFQVASQFNLLEMVSPDVSPDDGIARYALDRTQGPACAMACGAGTVFRNYFVQTGHNRTGVGQNAWYQLDMLADLGAALGNRNDNLWHMQNGYALPKDGALQKIAETIASTDRAHLKSLLRIGVQHDTAVTIDTARHTVNQAYCSALPVAYSALPAFDWDPFARLILEASYEATLHIASQHAPRKPVYLTLLGGGAFGNPSHWISDAILTALDKFRQSSLDVRIVSYGQPSTTAADVITRFSAP